MQRFRPLTVERLERIGVIKVNIVQLMTCMRTAHVRIPSHIVVQTADATEALDRKRRERLAELAADGWRPANGWLFERRQHVALNARTRQSWREVANG